MATLKYWLWLTGRRGLGNAGALRVLDHFVTPERAFYADPEEYALVEDLTPAARRVLLRRLGFRVKEEYEMEAAYPWEPEMWPWVRLTNGVAVCLKDGFVSRAEKGGGRRG